MECFRQKVCESKEHNFSESCLKLGVNEKDGFPVHKNNLKTLDFLQQSSQNGNFDVYGGFSCLTSLLKIRW